MEPMTIIYWSSWGGGGGAQHLEALYESQGGLCMKHVATCNFTNNVISWLIARYLRGLVTMGVHVHARLLNVYGPF